MTIDEYFIDFEKTFDKKKHDRLICLLKVNDADGPIVRIIQKSLEGTNAGITVIGKRFVINE